MNNDTKKYQKNSEASWWFGDFIICRRALFSFIILLLSATVSIGLSNKAYAGNVYSTGFEQPIFNNGDLLLGLNGWTTAIPPFLNPQAAIITNVKPISGSQSVVVKGTDLIGSEGITAPYDAIGSYRRPVGAGGLGMTLTGSNSLVRIDADLLLATTQPKTPGEFFSLTIAARSGDGETLGEVGLSSPKVL